MENLFMQCLRKVNSYSDGKIFAELIQPYSENLTDWNDEETEPYMEEAFDLIELQQILNNHAQNIANNDNECGLRSLNNIWEFLNSAQFICSPGEIKNIPIIQKFMIDYGNLYRTMEPWNHGNMGMGIMK